MSIADDIAVRRADWAEAVCDRDVEAYAQLVTEDLVWLPPMGEAIEGRDAFRQWVIPFFERFEYSFSAEASGVWPIGRWCAELGRFRSVLFVQPGGDRSEHSGRYFILWRQDDDGQWRIERYADVTGR